jgi:hypothetical protein
MSSGKTVSDFVVLQTTDGEKAVEIPAAAVRALIFAENLEAFVILVDGKLLDSMTGLASDDQFLVGDFGHVDLPKSFPRVKR